MRRTGVARLDMLLRLVLIAVGSYLAYHTWIALDRGVLFASDGEPGLVNALLGEPVPRDESPVKFWVGLACEAFFGGCCLVGALLPSAQMHAMLGSMTR